MAELSNMIQRIFKKAEDLLNQGEFEKSFALFRSITENPESSISEKADSYNMMGALILISPDLDLEDETGLKYFKKSIELDEFNVGALLNIIETFGLSHSSHKNVSLLDFAIKQIYSADYKLTNRDVEMIKNKSKIKNEILNRGSDN